MAEPDEYGTCAMCGSRLHRVKKYVPGAPGGVEMVLEPCDQPRLTAIEFALHRRVSDVLRQRDDAIEAQQVLGLKLAQAERERDELREASDAQSRNLNAAFTRLGEALTALSEAMPGLPADQGIAERVKRLAGERDWWKVRAERLGSAVETFLALHTAASGRSCMCVLCQRFRTALAAEEGKVD